MKYRKMTAVILLYYKMKKNHINEMEKMTFDCNKIFDNESIYDSVSPTANLRQIPFIVNEMKKPVYKGIDEKIPDNSKNHIEIYVLFEDIKTNKKRKIHIANGYFD